MVVLCHDFISPKSNHLISTNLPHNILVPVKKTTEQAALDQRMNPAQVQFYALLFIVVSLFCLIMRLRPVANGIRSKFISIMIWHVRREGIEHHSLSLLLLY